MIEESNKVSAYCIHAFTVTASMIKVAADIMWKWVYSDVLDSDSEQLLDSDGEELMCKDYKEKK